MDAGRLLAALVLLSLCSIASSFAPSFLAKGHTLPGMSGRTHELGAHGRQRAHGPKSNGLARGIPLGRGCCALRAQDPASTKERVRDFAAGEEDRDAIEESSAQYGVTLETDAAILAEGRRIVWLCCFVGVISSLDRQAMSVAIVPMSKAMGYSDTVKGSISSIFSLGYTLALLPLGAAQQLVSARLLMAGGVIAWSSFTLLTPAAADDGVSELLAVRMFVGAAEAVTVPTVQTFVARWIPPTRRSSALALLSTAFQVGTIAALITAPKIVAAYGWEGVFYIFGGLGFVWVGAWLRVAKDAPPLPPQAQGAAGAATPDAAGSRSSMPAEGLVGDASRALGSIKALPWEQARRSRALWATAAAHSAHNWGLYVSLAWLPTFFSASYDMDLSESALYSVLPYVSGALASAGAGWAADEVLERGVGLATVRRIFQGVASFGPALCMTALALNVDSASGAEGDVIAHMPPQLAAALFVGSVTLGTASAGGFASSLLDISAEYSGFLYGLTTVVCASCGALGVYTTGWILDETHSFSAVFACTAAVYTLGGLIYSLNYDAKPLLSEEDAEQLRGQEGQGQDLP